MRESTPLDRLVLLNARQIAISNYIDGHYDVEHLKRFHSELLKDSEEIGYFLNPGILRSKSPDNVIYQRDREVSIGSIAGNSFTFPVMVSTIHSKMSGDDIKLLNQTLSILREDTFNNLLTEKFAYCLSDIYVKCDFIHPFNDINTRTLSSFLNQFSCDCGFRTFFDPFIDKTSDNMKDFYIARAKSVNEYGIKLLNKEDQFRLRTQMSRFCNFPNFSEFLAKNTLPYRAIAFNDLIADSAENSKGDLRLFLYNMHHNAQFVLSSYPELKEPIDVLKGTIGHTIKNQKMTVEQKEIFINNAAQSACGLLAKGYHTFNSKQLYEESCKNLNIHSITKTDKGFDR